MTTCQCKTCNNVFKTHPYRILQGVKYCSSRCYGIAKKNYKPTQKQLDGLKSGHGWNKGIKNPLGEKHPNWKGGITGFVIKIRRCFEYKLWRENVFKRDDYTCCLCKSRNGNGKKIILNADHYPKTFSNLIKEHCIKSYNDSIECKELWDINNGRTLCRDCHLRETSIYQKVNWKNKTNLCPQ